MQEHDTFDAANSTGILFNVQRFCTHDGPGIRTTVFLKGCPLRCRWCHNPEGLSRRRELAFDPDKCIGCRACEQACEHEAHVFHDDGTHEYRSERCVVCGRCADVCYSGALEMIGEAQTARHVMDVVLRDKPFYDASGGGVTLSGGEPLYQPEFSRAILSLCRESGISTAVESSCATQWTVMARFLPLVDAWMCDVKHMDASRHRALTGSDNRALLSNIRRLCASGARVLLRLPLIPGLNDDAEGLRALGRFVREADPKDGIEIIPYHRLGGGKYERLRRVYSLPTLDGATDDDVRRAAALLREGGAARVFCERVPDL